MPESEHRLDEEALRKLERELTSNDRLADRLRVGTHYGSIEAAEERRFPWLKARRRRRPR